MSDAHSTSPSAEDSSLIKTPTQLSVVVVLAFVVPIAAIFTIIHFVVGGDKSRANPAMSDKAVAERIKPVGSTPDIEKGPSPLVPAPAPLVAIAPGTDAGKAAAADGKAVYETRRQSRVGAAFGHGCRRAASERAQGQERDAAQGWQSDSRRRRRTSCGRLHGVASEIIVNFFSRKGAVLRAFLLAESV